MNRADLEIIFEEFGKCHIGVIGDYCLDAYWTLDVGEREHSVETGKPTHAVMGQRYSLGGAANIVANLAALEVGSVHAFSVIGDDLFGRELLSQLDQLGVERSGIVQDADWQTAVYCKRYHGAEELERIDIGRFNSVQAEAEQQLLQAIESAMRGLDVLIFNGQISGGVYSDTLFKRLLELAADKDGCQIVLDFRVLPPHFKNMIVKLNANEAASYYGDTWDVDMAIPEGKVKGYAEHIFEESQRQVMITRGARGLLIYDGETHHTIPGIQFLKPIDSVGAGDTTIATWGACLATKVSLPQASQLASISAGVTVQKLQQTGRASPAEIMAFAEDIDYVYRPELAEDIRQAHYLDGSQIEIIHTLENRGTIQHAVFDHDGTISVLREGWEPVMEAMMIRVILGDQYKTVSEADYQHIATQARQFIDKSTGIQTIVQMQSLVDMIAEFGYVPQASILSASDYKEIYNDALMEQINIRKKRIDSKELGVADFTLKGAVDVLQALAQRGVKLYLASGTDAEDVKIEANILGYAHLFEGRIYGAVGDIRKYSKKMVIDQIIRENNLQGTELITFGDGPVEIRETKKRGGITVGVASDEVRRFGINAVKRTRLIQAGADFIIPDYAQLPLLMQQIMG
jgi:rfaE bifunctional protein kinase chain/domain